MCNKCNKPDYSYGCGCNDGCSDGCDLKLDFSCIVYNKNGNNASTLDGLNLPNGSTLKVVAELLDDKVKQLNVIGFNLPILRGSHVINNIQQLTESIDIELGNLKDQITETSDNGNVVLSTIDSSTIAFTKSGTLNHTLTGSVKIGSPEESNCLTAQSDGLVAVPQNLSLNYTTKELSISKGNTVNLSSLITSSFLGSVTSDPSGAINGNYWYNSAQSKLKIKVNNVVKEILTA